MDQFFQIFFPPSLGIQKSHSSTLLSSLHTMDSSKAKSDCLWVKIMVANLEILSFFP
jgi:hypothetical protein